MQAIATKPQATPKALARDLFTLLAYLLKASSQDVFREVGELDLSLTQIKLLHVLEHADDPTALTELAERLALSLPAASRAIEGLHRRGFVDRRENELDRRMKHVEATAAGRRVVQRLNQARLSFLEQFASTLSDAEQRRLEAALAPLVARDQIGACRPGRSGR